jgi:hypothetical protein
MHKKLKGKRRSQGESIILSFHGMHKQTVDHVATVDKNEEHKAYFNCFIYI